MSRAAHVLWLGLAASALAAAGPTTGTPETLRVVADEWCPYTCAHDAGQQGYMIDVVRAIFAPLGYRIDYQVLPWSRALEDGLGGRADAVAGATPENAAGLILPAVEAGQDVSTFAVRPDDPWHWSGVASLRERHLGVIADYTYHPDVDAWVASQVGRTARVQQVSGADALAINLRKLDGRRIDTVIENVNVLRYATRQQGTPPFRVEGDLPGSRLYVAFSPARSDGPALARAFSAGMERLRENGELQRILDRYGLTDWRPGTPGATEGTSP